MALQPITQQPKPKPIGGLMTAAAGPISAMDASPAPSAAPGIKPTGLPPSGQPAPVDKPVPDTSVAAKVTELTGQDSPLMQQARTDALKYANRRGLLNSSIAAGASQESVIRAATPIASQDSSQAFQRGESALNRSLELTMQDNAIAASDRQQLRQIASTEGLAAAERALQELMQGKDIASREKLGFAQMASTEGLAKAQRELDKFMQGRAIDAAKQQQIRDLASREGMAAAERALQTLMQGRDITSREKLTLAQISSTEGMAAAERALEDRMQSRALSTAERQQIRDINSREGLAAAERALQTTMQQREIGYQTAERKLDRGLQEKLASWNLAATDRNAAAQFLYQQETLYQESYQAIMANTALSADQRTAQLNSAKALRDRQIDFVQQLFDIKLEWGQAKPGKPGSTPLPQTEWAKTNKPNAQGYWSVPGDGDGKTKNPAVAYAYYKKNFKPAA